VLGCQSLELPVAQHGIYVVTDHALVALIGRRLDGAFDQAVQPAFQERRKRLVLALEDHPLAPIRERLDELLVGCYASAKYEKRGDRPAVGPAGNSISRC
jgi:hypothetical protein